MANGVEPREEGPAMNISSRCEYACRAMVELARHHHKEKPVTAVHIAERRGIPEKYLVHILLQLKRAGLVRSIRGAQGGYLLTRPAGEVTLLDVVQAIDGPILEPLPAGNGASGELALAWREAAEGITAVLAGMTIAGILERAQSENMYYI